MKFKFLFLLVLLVVSTSACATSQGVKVGGGWTLGFETNTVVVTNATTLPGQLLRNGEYVSELQVGDVQEVRLGGQVRNVVLTFRNFEETFSGRNLEGISTRSFRGGAGSRYEWTIRSVQPIR